MEHYIGIDAHCEYSDIAVVDERGVLVSQRSVKTGAKNLIEAVCKVKDTRIVIVEESTLAGWLQRTLGPYADHVSVVDPKRNALISRSENKSDRSDAHRLAWLYRGGYTRAVHHTEDMGFLEFKEMVLHYHDCVNQVIRFKNKLKGVYRQHGQFRMPAAIYCPTEGPDYIKRLPFASTRHRARTLLSIIETAERKKTKAQRKLTKMSGRFPAVGLLLGIPGVGPIIASTVVAIIETPHRFPTKEHLWKYCCLSVAKRASGGKSTTGHASREGNRVLKKVLMQAAHNAAKTDSRFGRRYREVRERRDNSVARRTVARMIIATMYGMWRSGECYRELG
jgi:hypothetical protein